MIMSGTVFAFDENATGIKRWTDGALWSPSRIIGNYLVYRELDKKGEVEPDKSAQASAAQSRVSPYATPNSQLADPFDGKNAGASGSTLDTTTVARPSTAGGAAPTGSTGLQRDLERALVGS